MLANPSKWNRLPLMLVAIMASVEMSRKIAAVKAARAAAASESPSPELSGVRLDRNTRQFLPTGIRIACASHNTMAVATKL